VVVEKEEEEEEEEEGGDRRPLQMELARATAVGASHVRDPHSAIAAPNGAGGKFDKPPFQSTPFFNL